MKHQLWTRPAGPARLQARGGTTDATHHPCAISKLYWLVRKGRVALNSVSEDSTEAHCRHSMQDTSKVSGSIKRSTSARELFSDVSTITPGLPPAQRKRGWGEVCYLNGITSPTSNIKLNFVAPHRRRVIFYHPLATEELCARGCARASTSAGQGEVSFFIGVCC